MIFGRFKRKLVFAGVIGALAVSCGFSSVSGDVHKAGNISAQEQPAAESEPDGGQEDPETESVLKWLTDKASSGEIDLKDEDSIRRAIDEAEEEFGTSYDEKERERIVAALQKLDAIGTGADEMLEQAKKLYQKYGEDVVQEANDAINDAVETAVKSATDNFFESMKKAVSDFFKDLFSKES